MSQLQSSVKSDEAAVDNVQAQLSYANLTPPFYGITRVRQIDVGNIVHPTDTQGLVTMTQVQDALAAGTVKAVAYDQAGNKALDTGRLIAVAPSTLPSCHAARGRLHPDPP